MSRGSSDDVGREACGQFGGKRRGSWPAAAVNAGPSPAWRPRWREGTVGKASWTLDLLAEADGEDHTDDLEQNVPDRMMF